MLTLAPEGFEEAARGDDLELVAYTDAAGAARIRDAFPAVAVERVPAGWEDAWRSFHRPVRIGPLWVGPPWLVPDPGSTPVVIDPGQAFGTGSHPTTRLCLRLLLDVPPGSLADLGCGSGVLSVAAAKLGFAPVLAFDSDAATVAAAVRNAAANGVDVAVRRADVLRDPVPDVDAAVANVTREAVERLAARVRARTLLTSGYLAHEEVSPAGWRRRERREEEGWAADRFTRG